MASNTRTRGPVGAVAAAALALGGIVAAAPATADSAAAAELQWGFRKSFRNYVGQQIGAFPPTGPLPEGERITLLAPAEFDLAGEPAAPANGSEPNETLPYLFPVQDVDFVDAENFEVRTAGGVTYSFPSHFFTISLSNVGIDVEDGQAGLLADLTVVIPPNNSGFDEGTYEATAVELGEIADVSIAFSGADVTVIGTGVTITEAGAAGLQGFLNEGDELDDLTIGFQQAPWFSAAPQSASVAVGGTARFAATVTGADSLQWQSRTGAGAWTDVAGATAAALDVAASSVSQSGTQYRVVATNVAGTIESAPATLTVTKAAAQAHVKVKKKFRFAVKRKATITVDAPAGVAATGAVVVKAGKKVVGKGTVTNGKAKVTLTKKLLPGKRSLVAEFAGNAELAPATSAAVKVQVKKAKSKTKPKIAKKKKLKAGTRPVLRLRVTGKNVKPKGKVRIVVREGKKKIRTITVKVKGGKVTKVQLPRLDRGKFRVRAQFQGNKKIAKSAKKVTFRVR